MASTPPTVAPSWGEGKCLREPPSYGQGASASARRPAGSVRPPRG
ncbi:hypothetical protein [Ornithinimicrobium kibberense]